MRRAWAIFRQTYKYPLIKFLDIGRNCFAWALRQAWGEARGAARVAAIPVQVRAERNPRISVPGISFTRLNRRYRALPILGLKIRQYGV
jgi:hypothetical protein